MTAEKIKTYGLEMVLLTILVFISIIGATILAYDFFIEDKVTESLEYQTAVHFVRESESVSRHLLAPIKSISFDDVRVVDRKNYGVCEITFKLILQNKLTEHLRVNLVKVADFWIVYEALLSPDTPAQYELLSTYHKILYLLERLDYQDIKAAQELLNFIQQELKDSRFVDFLIARVSAYSGDTELAITLLNQLENVVNFSRTAVLYERAMIDFTSNNFAQALTRLAEVQQKIEAELQQEDYIIRMRSLFAKLPKDPLIVSFLPEHVLADVYQTMSLAYYQLSDFNQAFEYAEKAILQAETIDSKVIKSSSLFIKSLALFALNNFEVADSFFIQVINDLDNSNLTQKSWAYFYRGLIASHFSRDSEALDYYEMGVSLDPFNFPVRRGAIEYLLDRHYSGDLEIALGMALRGMDYDIDGTVFRDFASLIYTRLNMPDKTRKMD